MIKILTTQNLNSSRRMKSTNSDNIPNDEIRLNYSELMRNSKHFGVPEDTYENSVSFKGKKKIIKEVVDKSKKAANKKKSKSDEILKSGFFDKLLDLMGHEVAIQAAISCIICLILRPLTIMAIPTKKNKQDNMYAAAHSMSSGILGLCSSMIIATPFSKGIKYANKNLLKDMNLEVLKKKYPNLNIKSIWKDEKNNIRKPVEEWLDTEGNKFSTEFKSVLTVAQPKPISTVSEETLKEAFGIDIDLNAMKDKSVNEWTDRQGKKIHFDIKDMFIAVEEEGMGGSLKDYKDTNFFSLKFIDENFLKEIMPDLDINSIKGKSGERLHPDLWKKTDGTPYKLDMDMIHLSSYRETATSTPLYTGKKRIELKRNGEAKGEKYLSYQLNNGWEDTTKVPDKLGSTITQAMLEAEATNEISNKLLGWFPDIATRIPIATGTIALLPVILKYVFHLEKSKKPAEAEVKVQENNTKLPEEQSGKAVA